MLNRIQIASELQRRLAQPQYRLMVDDMNSFRTKASDKLAHQKTDRPHTASSIASEAARAIVLNDVLIAPKVEELQGYLELYRAHDGGSGTRRGSQNCRSAETLGASWVSLDLVANIWRSSEGMSPDKQKVYFKDVLRSCALILKGWNAMTHWVCMQVPKGCSVVVVSGRGSWNAMLKSIGPDEMSELDTMARDPTLQYFVPLYRSSWVFPIQESSPSWPFLPRR